MCLKSAWAALNQSLYLSHAQNFSVSLARSTKAARARDTQDAVYVGSTLGFEHSHYYVVVILTADTISKLH